MATAENDELTDVTLWYHTLDLPNGVVTPGWFDLRSIVDKLPWPEVKGKRCLDVGTYDGYLAFEMERRGAAEVVAIDIPDHESWDWPARARAKGPVSLAEIAGPKGRGFEVARDALGSKVQKVERNVYDLTVEELGTFDVVVCGSLMLHLRDPIRALEAIRPLCSGEFMSTEEVSLTLSLLHRKRPVADARLSNELCQWWVVNAAGHINMLQVAGFDIIKASGLYGEEFGSAHPASTGLKQRIRGAVCRATIGNTGVPHHAALCRPGI